MRELGPKRGRVPKLAAGKLVKKWSFALGPKNVHQPWALGPLSIKKI